MRSVFHELVHFHHLLGTTYGVYYYTIALTQLAASLISLKAQTQEGRKVKLPIKNGILPVIKGMYEGFLDQLEQSETSSLLENTDLDALEQDNIRLGVQERELYDRQRKTKEIISLPVMFYDLKFNTGKELKVPVGGRAIMENYAKHLEFTTGFASGTNEKEIDKHFDYFFLSLYSLTRLKEIPDNLKHDLLSCLYYLSLMGTMPGNSKDKYFGIFFKKETFSPIETINLLKPPGLVFHDALTESIKIIESRSRALDDLDSFLEELCPRIELSGICELNIELKDLTELCLDEIGKASYFQLFPFIEYYLKMSLKFANMIQDNPVLFAKGDITRRLVSYLSSPDTDKNCEDGFMGGYPVPNIYFEHTYDKAGNVIEYTGWGDAGEDQLLLEFYLDLYDQLFTGKELYCYEARHLSAVLDSPPCKRIRDCAGKNKPDYNNCTNTHKILLETFLGGYKSLA